VIRVIRNGSIQPYVSNKAQVNVFTMSAISGLAERWLVELHDSFGSIEDVDRTLSNPASTSGSDEVLGQATTLIAVYRPGLSYRPDDAGKTLARMRYFNVTICRIRPGAEADFAKPQKLRGLSLDSINIPVVPGRGGSSQVILVDIITVVI